MDIISYLLSRQFTKQSLIGMGALKGSPCQVKNIVHQNGINTVTFEWEGTDGSKRESQMVVYDGTPIYVWESGNTYHYGDLAIYESQFYRCIVENSDVTFDNTKWNEIGSPDGNYDIVQSKELLPARFTAADRKLYYVIDEHLYYLWDGTQWVAQTQLVQANVLPNPQAKYEGRIYQYIGVTNANFVHGLVYECVSDGLATYSWQELATTRVEQATQNTLGIVKGGKGTTINNEGGIDVDVNEFIGTQAQWDALTTAQQNQYDIVNITGDQQDLNLGQYLRKVSVMPNAEDAPSETVLYVGATTPNYTQGFTYRSVPVVESGVTTYHWESVFGTAAQKDCTDNVRPNNHDLVESQAVYSAINSALSSIYVPRGDLSCSELTASLLIPANIGNVYTMSDSGTTSALFINGAGHPIAANDNVGIIRAGQDSIMFNLMGNAFDLHDYQTKELETPLIIGGATVDTVEGALGALNNENILHYDVMPSTSDLLAMANNTIFFTKGFYDVYDGFGGYYLISTSSQRGALKIEGTSSNKYLTALDTNGRYMEYIEACRYGVRPYTDAIDFSTITKSNTYADINSDILSRIYLPTNKATLKFGVGKFFFADTINIDGSHRQLNIKGELVGIPQTSRDNRYSTDNSQGTALYFPFLENGEYGIVSAFGSIENVCIIGNPLTYDIAFDRTKAISAPNEVITETVAQSSGSDVKCTAIYKEGNVISNVYIMNFYTAIENKGSNIYMHNIHARYCHDGFMLKSDNKCRDLYGADVHTLITINGSLVSVQQARVDSCVSVVKLLNGNGIVLNDIDGDWCTDSLIVVGEGESNTAITEGTFTALRGRCCTLKGATTPVDARDLVDTSGYGIIRLVRGTFKDNTIQISSIGNRPVLDTSSTYKTPYIILTWAGDGTTTVIENTRFIINEDSYVNLIDDIRKIYQPRSGGYNYNFSITTSKDIYYINKNQVYTGAVQMVDMPTISTATVQRWLGRIVQYIGTTNSTYTHGYFYECVSDGAVSPSYSWVEATDYVTSTELETRLDGIKYYDVMPSTVDLIAMDNNTVFFTQGYYNKSDKCGGYYIVTTTATKGALMLQDNGGITRKYLVALEEEGYVINACRYGIRSANIVDNITTENTFATANSNIMDLLYYPYLNTTLKFPSGRFYFERPIKYIETTEISIIGEKNSAVTDESRIVNIGFDCGTILVFPFLTNGQTAITMGSGTLKNVTVMGDFNTYNITFDRSKIISAPNEVITETIKIEDGSEVKCTGINKGAVLENVSVCGFYTGIRMIGGNLSLDNINVYCCHTGIIICADNKCTNIFGYNVYHFIETSGSCSCASITKARVDSCVHMLVTYDYSGRGCVFSDLDGDWCTDTLIYATKTNQYGSFSDATFDNIRGRCCTLKSYDSTQSSGVDVRDLADTSGYGIIRADDNVNFVRNYVSIVVAGDSPSDVTNYLTPNIVLTYGTNSNTKDNIFIVNGVINPLKTFQLRSGLNNRVDTSQATYYLNGTDVIQELQGVEFTSQELQAMW